MILLLFFLYIPDMDIAIQKTLAEFEGTKPKEDTKKVEEKPTSDLKATKPTPVPPPQKLTTATSEPEKPATLKAADDTKATEVTSQPEVKSSEEKVASKDEQPFFYGERKFSISQQVCFHFIE